MWICPKCGEKHEDTFDTCWNCNYSIEKKISKQKESVSEIYDNANKLYDDKKYNEAVEVYKKIIKDFPSSNEASYAKLHIEAICNSTNRRKIPANFPFIMTTANNIEGYTVIKTIQIISAECSYGMNIFKDFFTSVTDTFGGRSITLQKTLKEARKNCLKELKQEAFELGANAVIAVNLNYSQFTGKGKSMLFLVATGTAVIVEKVK